MADDDGGRGYRRFVVELPASVAGVSMATANLSLEGTQVVCPQLRYDLHAEKLAARPLALALYLDDDSTFSVACRVRYVSSSEDEVLLGLQFGAETGEEVDLTPVATFLENRGGARYSKPIEHDS